ncbi:hypothetical protein OJAV_G00182510 [Oryzias javanicus]|uniref:Uncharacterized protein n=1 Tax=Oryzias javanicus TaxID=123683 RepID=A0A437CE63_ORYJA|nr:hypothetical protein OJAV_G00182510 [Oryzias javanicus]
MVPRADNTKTLTTSSFCRSKLTSETLSHLRGGRRREFGCHDGSKVLHLRQRFGVIRGELRLTSNGRTRLNSESTVSTYSRDEDLRGREERRSEAPKTEAGFSAFRGRSKSAPPALWDDSSKAVELGKAKPTRRPKGRWHYTFSREGHRCAPAVRSTAARKSEK